MGHNEQFDISKKANHTPEQWEQKWFDSERVVDGFIKSIANRSFLAETFPIFWPNLGPDVYSVFYGGELKYDDITSWSIPFVKDWSDTEALAFNISNEYFQKIIELTEYAIQKSELRYLTGYTDLHPGMDCVLAWRGTEQLCYDMLDSPEMVKKMVELASGDFKNIYDYFDSILKNNHQMSVTWMEIPSFGKLHIPSCDFATMMSPSQFNEFALPAIIEEMKQMTHNIFHLDGPGVAKNLDTLLEIPEITAIQWVQGVGKDEPIMQWASLIKRIQEAGKSVVVSLQKEELDDFITALKPEGVFLCIAGCEREQELEIIRKVEKW